MAFIIGIILFLIFLRIESVQKSRNKQRYKLLEENIQTGKAEYLLSWHIFRNEIVPEVYRAWGDTRINKVITFYDREFEEIGLCLYKRDPADEAIVRAKKVLIESGQRAYSKNWCWDDRTHNVSEITKLEQTSLEHQSASNCYARPDVTFCLYDYMFMQYGKDTLRTPTKEDYRRYYYLASDMKTHFELKDSNVSSYHKWNTPQNRIKEQLQREGKLP